MYMVIYHGVTWRYSVMCRYHGYEPVSIKRIVAVGTMLGDLTVSYNYNKLITNISNKSTSI